MRTQISTEEAEQLARAQFQDAVRNFFASADKPECKREQALDRLHAARGVLVIDFAYSLEELIEVVERSDETRSFDDLLQ